MKAWVLKNNGQIEYTDINKPEINSDEVLVEVKAAGICGSDIPRIYNSGAYFYPLVPGHEFSGKVVFVNKGDEDLIDKRVGIFPLIPCRECVPCQKNQYEMCKSYSYLGSRRNGGFAQFVSVPKSNLIMLPDNVSYEEAAMLEPMSVAAHAIRKVAPLKSNSVAICGLGTIGMFILMFLLEMGINDVYVIGNKPFQKELALKAGISEDRYIESNGGKSVSADIFFECVGKNETITRAINETLPGGKIMLVGNPHSDMSFDKATYWKILRHQLSVFGTWNSSFTGDTDDDWHYVLEKLSQKRIAPSMFISHTFEMPELNKGFLIMKDKTEDYIKIMMTR